MKKLFCLVAAVILISSGCRSAGRQYVAEAWPAGWSDDVVAELARPLPGPMAALYRMRVPSTGGLRLGVIVSSDGVGRMTVSEPFGAAVMVAGWDGGRSAEVFDLKDGCRLTRGQAARAIGLGALPMDRAARLLGGRFPDRPDDEILEIAPGELVIEGGDWRAEVSVARDPWRVVAVRNGGFTVTLDKHTSSLPGRLKILDRSGESVLLVLNNLKWETSSELPPLPDLPACGEERGNQ